MKHRLPAIIVGTVSSLLLAACASGGGYYDDRYGYNDNYRYQNSAYDRYDNRYARCDRCGVVVDIQRFYGEGRASGGGAVAGAVVGGLVGSQDGSGSGPDAAPNAGAVAGGVAGHNIEKDRREGYQYAVHVEMDNGRRVVVEQRDLNGVREGSRVIVDGGRARLM